MILQTVMIQTPGYTEIPYMKRADRQPRGRKWQLNMSLIDADG
jgi:hypothetical protein